jgi:hypothetical protein
LQPLLSVRLERDRICDARMPTNEQQVLSIRAWCFADRKGLLTPSTPFGVSAGHIALFGVVSRS